MSELFGSLQAAGPVGAATGDTAWLQAMLDAEAALAWAQADVGLLPVEHARAIAEVCRADAYDAGEIGAAAVGIGNPAAPLVEALTARVADPVAAGSVHRGATSQDIVDTAAMLIARRALDGLTTEVSACADLLAILAEQHACTPQVGRSLLQQALPVTFGLTAAGWLSALGDAGDRLADVRDHRLAVQLGGAAGTLASLGDSGPAVVQAFARRLDLTAPELPWHTDRGRITELAGALGTVCGAVAKISGDIALLAQTEIGEVSEVASGAGGSSTLPHKRNPIAAVLARSAAAQAPGLVSTLFAAAAHELQRAAGAWHAEWRPLGELLRCTGTAVHWLRISLSRLQIHPVQMRRNLARTGGLLMAERITTALTPTVGRLAAHRAVSECARGVTDDGSFAVLLAAHPVVRDRLDDIEIAALLEPSTYVGSARVFVDRAVGAQARRGMKAQVGRPGGVVVNSVADGDAENPPVLLINALGSDLSIWDGYPEALATSGFRVIRYDARGHGDSPVPAGPYALEDLGGDVLALLDRLEIEAAHIVGVSLGGMTGLWLAAHHPDRVRGLVACCTSARPGNTAMWLERAAQVRSEGMSRIADASVQRWFTADWRERNPEMTRRMRDLTAETPVEGYAACCEALAHVDLIEDLPRITAPTLVLSTAQDPAFPADHGRLIAEHIPGADFDIIDDAGHLGTVEQSGRFLRSITTHLRRTT